MKRVKGAGPHVEMLRTLVLCTGMAVLGAHLIGCAIAAPKKSTGGKGMASKAIEQVLQEQTPGWMSLPGVVGTGIGEHDGNPCIKVLVVKRTKELDDRIPSTVDGFLVITEETGEVRALEGDSPD